jgi:hypothetical protein
MRSHPLQEETLMEEQYGQILLAKIECDPTFQVRQSWDPDRDPTLPALVQSLTGPERQIHPIVVVARTTPTTFGRTYTLITGHRRLAAAHRAGWERILARILPPCDLTALPERLRLLAMAIHENTVREPLPTEDRRDALRRLKALYETVHPRSHVPAARVQDPAVAAPPGVYPLGGHGHAHPRVYHSPRPAAPAAGLPHPSPSERLTRGGTRSGS